MSRALIVLDTELQRRKAADWVWSLKPGTRVEFKAPKRSDDQNSLMWVLLTKISVSLKWHGKHLTPDDWKLQFLDALRRAKNEELRIVPNIDNTGFVNLSASSSDLSKDEMSDMIELIHKFGADHGVDFQETPTERPSPSAGAGSDIEAPSTGSVAADPSDTGDGVDEEAGDMGAREEPVASSASVSLSADDKAFLVRVFHTLKAAVGPDVNVLKRQALIFTDEIGGKSDLVRAKAKTIRERLQDCCGDDPKSGTVAEAKYLAGIIGVDDRELAG